MAGGTRTMVFVALLSSFSVWAGSARAGIDLPPWSVPCASGFDNPIFWVLFNPQPEPPGRVMVVDPSDPTAPVFTVKSNSLGKFSLVFAIQNISDLFSDFRCVTGSTGLQVLALSSTGPLYAVNFSFESGGAAGSGHAAASLSPGSDVMFNPQPEPPGEPGVIVSFSLVDPASGAPPLEGSEVGMTLQISGPGGELMSLTPLVPFVRGDTNSDDTTDMSDAVAIFGYLFLGDTTLTCEQAGDANDDGILDLSDGIRILTAIFLGGTDIAPPVEGCGIDPTGHSLSCSSYPRCM